MAIYTSEDLAAINAQIKQRRLYLALPAAVLLALVVVTFIARIQVLTILCIILLGVLLIAGHDLTLKPLLCYQEYLTNALSGRHRACTLPFVALSDNVDLVDGVNVRAMTCQDVDGKGRPYERLFYFDAQKDFPDVQPGDILHITHHELSVADVEVV